MLTRIITGVTLTVVVLGLLTLDYFTYPWSLGLLALCLGALCMAARERAHLRPNANKPHPGTAMLFVAALVACCRRPLRPGP